VSCGPSREYFDFESVRRNKNPTVSRVHHQTHHCRNQPSCYQTIIHNHILSLIPWRPVSITTQHLLNNTHNNNNATDGVAKREGPRCKPVSQSVSQVSIAKRKEGSID